MAEILSGAYQFAASDDQIQMSCSLGAKTKKRVEG